MQKSGKVHRDRVYFIKNPHAVLGLPLRMTVSLFIGIITLTAILSLMMHPCLLPKHMVVSIRPMIENISGEEPQIVHFFITVKDSMGHPIQDASVLIRGLGGAGSNITDCLGNTTVFLFVHLEVGVLEGYLDVSVKAPCYTDFSFEDYIKIRKIDG